MKKISFTKADAYYGFMSNFTAYPIIVDGLEYRTTEHYFQSKKFVEAKDQEYVRTECVTPLEAKMAGACREYPILPDWSTARLHIMLTALRAKFTQHHDIQEKLLGTGDAQLVEHSRSDKFWGDGGGAPGAGQNMLGELLMQVRREIRQEKEKELRQTSKAPPLLQHPTTTPASSSSSQKRLLDSPAAPTSSTPSALLMGGVGSRHAAPPSHCTTESTSESIMSSTTKPVAKKKVKRRLQ